MKIRFIGKSLVWLIAIIFVIIAALGVWSYKTGRIFKKSEPTTTQTEDSNTEIIAKVAALMELPADELPSIATVTDKEKLADEEFFSRAELNDKLLIYSDSKLAIIYRPSTNKIVNVAPLSGDTSASDEQITTNTVKIALYNGTETSGITSNAEEKLKSQMSNIEITAKEKAQKNDYNKTIVIDINGQMGAQAQEIAVMLNGEVGSLPQGEVAPSADILVIVAE